MRYFALFLIFFNLPSFSSTAQERKILDSLLTIYHDATVDTLKIKACYALAWTYMQYDPSKSSEYTTEAMTIAKNLPDSSFWFKGIYYYGLIHRLNASYDSSLFYHEKYLSYQKKAKKNNGLIRPLFNMGVVASFQGRFHQSLEYYLEGLEYAKEHKDSFMIAEIYNSAGIIHRKLKNFSKSKEMIFSSLQIFEKLGELSSQANCLNNLGNIYAEEKDHENALASFKKAYAIDSLLQLNWGIAYQLNNIGSVLMDMGDLDKALSHFQQSLKIRISLKQKKEIGESLNKVSEVLHLKKKYKESLDFALQSEKVGKEIGAEEIERDGLRLLSINYYQLSDFKKAYDMQKRYIDLHDKLLGDEKVRLMSELQAKYESDEKDKHIGFLNDKTYEQANAIVQKEAEVKQQIFMRNVLFTGLVFIGLFGLFWIRMYRQKMRANNMLALKSEEVNQQKIIRLEKEKKILVLNAMLEGQEEERKRIAKDLHDGLGSLLAQVQMRINNINNKEIINPQSFTFTHKLINNACAEVRKIAYDMMPEALLKFGLISAIQDICYATESTYGIQVDFQVFGLEDRLDEKKEITLYRIVQELVNNVIKHARATEILIQISMEEEGIILTIEDNGIGFDASKVKNSGLGMRSIESRINYLNGILEIISEPQKGTTVHIEIPVLKVNLV